MKEYLDWLNYFSSFAPYDSKHMCLNAEREKLVMTNFKENRVCYGDDFYRWLLME